MPWMELVAAGLVPIAGAGGIIFYGSSVPTSQVFGPSLVRGPAGKKRIALTFDDGPAQPYTLQILDILRESGARATFFACGKNVERFPDIVRRVHAEGHSIGNHTFTHPFLYFKQPAFVAGEIDRTQAVIERATGERPRVFRPPYGVRWFGLFGALRERGLRCVQWSNASFDWRDPMTPEEIARAALRRIEDGAVILLHDGREPRPQEQVDASTTVRALPAIIEGVKKAGFGFATVDEFVG